jgi:hypothetical protein
MNVLVIIKVNEEGFDSQQATTRAIVLMNGGKPQY